MKAVVYKSTGSWYKVKTEAGVFLQARLKGVLKIDEDITSTNPIAVGDEVEIESESEGNAIILSIADRKNYINRVSPRMKYQQHIVASNVDQSIVLVTLKNPRTSTGFIDRYLVACELYHIQPIIIYNKADIYKASELELYHLQKEIYTKVGYKVALVSVLEKENTGVLQDILKQKITLLSGHSGAGKSSLLNSLLPEARLKTQNISQWSNKGMHTTTFAERFDLPFGGSIIDTPGMKEFGLLGVTKQELSHYFIEMKPYLPGCRFNNCMHFQEPDCAVKKAVVEEEISENRYLNYCSILDSLEE